MRRWLRDGILTISVNGTLHGDPLSPIFRVVLAAAGTMSHLRLDVLEPSQDLLVGQAVQGPRQPRHARSKGQVWVRQRGPDQVRGVRTDVAALSQAKLCSPCRTMENSIDGLLCMNRSDLP